MMLAMRGVVLALLVLCVVPGSHSPTVCIEGGLQNCPGAVGGATWLTVYRTCILFHCYCFRDE